MALNAQLNFILLGKKRAGKSSSGDTILGKEAFVSKKSPKSLTHGYAVESGSVNGIPVTVYDTPGFCDPEMSEEEIEHIIKKVLQKCESHVCVFLLVIKADTFTEEEKKTVEKIEKLLGEKCLKKTYIIFTREDELDSENITLKEFLEKNKDLNALVEKYDQRYQAFNNKKKGPSDQARLLVVNTLQRCLELKVSDGGRPLRQIPVTSPNLCDEPQTAVSSLSSTRIVLLGKSGVGKSAAGNTILGQKEFKSEQSMSSVSSECLEKCATVSERNVSVIDTPGFFDTQMQPEELMTEISRSIYLSSPGPHAFLIVFPVNNRFTEQEQQIPQMIEVMFGQEVLKYSIILFTHGDMLKVNMKELIEKNGKLRHLIQQCGGRFHIFNNNDLNNREQVNDLLQTIDSMIIQNGGGHYSNEMFQDALSYRQMEENRIIREEEERKQQKEKQRQKEAERRRNKSQNIRVHLGAEKRGQGEVKQKKKEIERMIHLGARESASHYEPKIIPLFEKSKSKSPEFEKFSSKYKNNLSMTAFVVSKLVFSGTFIGGCIGACIGAVLGIAGGPAAIGFCAMQGAIWGASIGGL